MGQPLLEYLDPFLDDIFRIQLRRSINQHSLKRHFYSIDQDSDIIVPFDVADFAAWLLRSHENLARVVFEEDRGDVYGAILVHCSESGELRMI